MLHGLRHLFWLEIVLGLSTGALSVVTVFWHDWIEAVFGVDPDKGTGSSEWLVVIGLLIATAILVSGAGFEWRRARLSEH
jgi:hypothetical protein